MIGKLESMYHNWCQCEISSLTTNDIDFSNDNSVTRALENIIIVGSCRDNNMRTHRILKNSFGILVHVKILVRKQKISSS